MPTIAKSEGRQLQTEVHHISLSSVYPPWWRGFESTCLPSPGKSVNCSVSEGVTKERDTSVAPHSGNVHPLKLMRIYNCLIHLILISL